MDNATDEFEQYRPLLLGLAYRLLGSMWDAEDIVQDAFVRWLGVDHDEVRETRAFLITVVSRLALDQLRSARVRREAYVGPWLPEPVATDSLGPLDSAELRDTVSHATLHLMERLSPPERAVFVLREAFVLPYDEIATIIAATPESCRQLHHRAIRHLGRNSHIAAPTRADHEKLLGRFLNAAATGDLAALQQLLSADVIAWNDGGGRGRAALRPITGADKVAAFLTGLLSRYPVSHVQIVDVNGEPALWTDLAGHVGVTTFEIHDDHITGIRAVLEPGKLTRVLPAVTRPEARP